MNNKKDLLIEIGTEDLPARLLLNMSNEFGELICKQIGDAELSYSSHEIYCTPRRLAIVVCDLDIKQKDQVIERKGPKALVAFDKEGKPTQAAIGFAKSCGVDATQLEVDDDPDNPRLTFSEKRMGQNTSELIPQIIESSIKKISVPKRMRWNNSDSEFIRPIRWLLVILGSETINTTLFGVKAGNVTHGHRFHTAKEITVKHPSAYKELLQIKGHVLADFKERQETILQQVEKLAKQVGGTASYTQALLDEITGLVEWPCALLGEFNAQFLEVHKELLISTMQDNQKYIPLLDEHGELLPQFIIVSNIDSKDPATVKRGNEKVIVPRFEDAMFFWQRDKNINIEENLVKLENVIYEKQLGTLKDKIERVSQLAVYLSNDTNATKKDCERAVELSKCDLVSETVAEFPKLQGIIGRNLAFINNESEQVCVAIEEQYLPKHSGGTLPISPVGITLGLADRIDTLIGIFAIGKKPTGLKDPYGLRRAALAVLRIIIETPLNINLSKCLEKAASFFPSALQADKAVEEVNEYINERYRAYFSDRDIPVDVIDSVLANHPTHPSDVAAKIDALVSFRKLPNAESLAAANKRIRNILKKIDRENIGQVDSSLFKENAENILHSALENLSNDVEKLFKENKYEQALSKLAELRQPVDSFFDDVMVMDKDEKLKANRIALLSRIDSLFMHVADFSRLQS
ncbi:MAG: glycine--tRNA ligase subunit beta [Gammaproteobacteria bacterium]|nr:MAG: glycine--tRNA ligase subunit beta [Gammaproteobacteria bacterium]